MKKLLFGVILLASAALLARSGYQASFFDVETVQENQFQAGTWEPVEPSAPAGCTRSQGYWKTHDEWPAEHLTLGGGTYDQEQALAILQTPPRGDATYILAHQLIAAQLNVLNEADDSDVAQTMEDADAWLAENPLGSAPSGAARETSITLAATLEKFNTGSLGPGACEEEDDADSAEDDDQAAPPRALPPADATPAVACSLQLTPPIGQAPLQVELTAAVTVTGNFTHSLAYVWQFTDGETSVGGLDQIHIYREPGHYTPRLQVVSDANPNRALCSTSADVAISAPDANYSLDAGCHDGGTAWLGVNAGSTWARGVLTATDQTLSFDLQPGQNQTFDLDHILYDAETWAYAVTSPEGTETGSLQLGPCTDLGTATCSPGWSGELHRGLDDKWRVTASGTGARAVRLATVWFDDQTWHQSSTSDLGTVHLYPDGSWSMDVAIAGPSDGKGWVEVMNQQGEWIALDQCSFEGEAPLGTWITLWGTSGTQAFQENTSQPQRAVMSWLVSGGWGPEDVTFWWVPCVRRRTDGGETEICGRHLVEPVDQWIRHSGTIIRFYPAQAMLLDNYVYWPWQAQNDFTYEDDTGKVYDLWMAHAGDLYQYAFGRGLIDFVPNPDVVEPGDLLTIRWGVDFQVPPDDPVYEAGTRLREHQAIRALIVAPGEDPANQAVLDSYGWGGEIYNPYHEVGWVPGDGDETNDLVPEPHHALDGFDPFGWLNGIIHSVRDALPSWNVKGKLD